MKRSLVFLSLILLSGSANAQSIFGGIRIEPNFFISNNVGQGQLGLNLEPALDLGVRLGGGFSMEGKVGILFSDYFGGVQYGFLASKNILDDRIYALGGIVLHSGFGGAHGTSIYQAPSSDVFTLLGGGIGLNVSKNFSAELHVYKTLSEKVGYSLYSNPYGIHKEYWKLYSAIKLSFGYYFTVPLEPGKEKTAAEEKSALEKNETEESAVEILKEERHLFLCGVTGIPYLFSTQLGCQVMNNFSVAGVFNMGVWSYPIYRNSTAGLKLTGYFSAPIIDNVSLEVCKDIKNFFSKDTKRSILVTVGGNNISDKFFHFYWEAGLISWIWDVKDVGRFPVFKVGTTLNFF